MADILFSKFPRRDSPHVATPDEPQEDNFAPPPPSEVGFDDADEYMLRIGHLSAQRRWFCDEPHRRPIETSKNPLERCNEIFERHDGKTHTQLKEEINFLMVVAGLFLAIVAAFTIESYKFLQEDKQDTMSDLLVEVVRLLNDTNAQGKAQLPKPFTPKHHAIVVNQLWFLSMILSLIAVAMGTFCLQWISALSRGTQSFTNDFLFHESLAVRQSRYDGLDGWGVRYAPEVLLFIVQLSIGLFICGLVYFLWNVSETATIPTLVITGIAAASFCLVNLLPFLQPLVGRFLPATLKVSQCPYKSPTSWFIYNAGIVCITILEAFFYLLRCHWFESPWQSLRSHWLSQRVTGFDWKTYDARMQTLRTNDHSEFSYFESGLISALNRFPYEGEAKDIISSYLDSLVPILNGEPQRAEELLNLYRLPDDEIACLFIGTDFTPVPPRRLNTTLLQESEYANQIKTDFRNAFILQRLSMRSDGSLDRSLFQCRLELYIRVKNSTEPIVNCDGSRLEFDQFLECPFRIYSTFCYEKMDLELKFQFLRCVRQLINTRRFNDDNIIGAAVIVRNETAVSLTLSRGPYYMPDPPAKEEYTGSIPNQPSPRNIQIGNISNQPDSGTTSSPPNDLETGGPKSATLNAGAEDHQLRSSFESLCFEVREQLSGLRRSDFKKEYRYPQLRYILHLPPEPEPESARTHTVIDVPEHERT